MLMILLAGLLILAQAAGIEAVRPVVEVDQADTQAGYGRTPYDVGLARKARRRGAAVYIAGATRPIRRVLLTHGVRPPHVRFRSTVADAIASARAKANGVRDAAPATASDQHVRT